MFAPTTQKGPNFAIASSSLVHELHCMLLGEPLFLKSLFKEVNV